MLALNLVTLAPCLAPSAVYWPQLATYAPHAGPIYLLATAIACAFLVLGVARAWRCSVSGASKIVTTAAAVLLASFALAMTGATAFYAKFSVYPRPVVLTYPLTDLRDSVDYATSSVAPVDAALLATAAVLLIALSVIAVRRVWAEEPALHRAIFDLLLGAALLWSLRDAPIQMGSKRFLMTEHSMAAAKYIYAAVTPFSSNRVELAAPYVPRVDGVTAVPSLPKVRHVLLIIAECLRADRLPAYGYARHTTPFIQSESDRWLVFERAYAHGPSSADGFPVLFNSKYFAAVTHDNAGANALWGALRDAGVRSAFLSSGAMEWAGIAHSLDLDHADRQMIASGAGPAVRWTNTDRRYDYAVDDAVPLRRYLELLDDEFSGDGSFVALHFVGSHYPFRYDDTPDIFLPSMRSDGGQAVPSEDWTTLVSNAFDNSIIHVDGLVRQAVKALADRGILDDAVVIVTSDHGESFGEHRTSFHGTTLYEEQVHVPLLIRVGSHLSPLRDAMDRRRRHVAGQVDLMPTVLHMLTGQVPAAQPFEGISWLTSARKPYELLLYRGIGEKIGFVTAGRKFIFDVEDQIPEEYSLTDDRGEHQNIWRGGERTVAQFTATLVRRGVLPQAVSPLSQ
jgi:glucan phosphoethanolaminetransferase (alkaline phosphatase superfamily)